MIDSIACGFNITGQGPALFLSHGIGESPLPDGDFVLNDLVEYLEEVRRQSGIEQAHFAGDSLGGMIGRLETRHMRGVPDAMREVMGEMGIASGSPVAV